MPRPLSERARADALEAARRVILGHGIGGFTVDAVARESGVAKTTLYRHWADRTELLVDTLRSLVLPAPAPDTGELRADLLLHFEEACRISDDAGMRRLFFGLMLGAQSDDEIRLVRDAFLAEKERPLHGLLRRAQERGELPLGLDLDLATDVVMGPVVSRALLRGRELTPSDVETLIDLAIAAMNALVRT